MSYHEDLKFLGKNTQASSQEQSDHGICTVCHSLCLFWTNYCMFKLSHVMRKPVMPYANNRGTDQPAHVRSLISAFVVRCLDSIIPLVSISEIPSLCLASVAGQPFWVYPGRKPRRQVCSSRGSIGFVRIRGLLQHFSVSKFLGILQYCNDPKFSDRQVWTNSADPDQTAPRSSLIRVYTACQSVCIFWTHSVVKWYYSNFGIITAFFLMSEFFGFLRFFKDQYKEICQYQNMLHQIRTTEFFPLHYILL